MEEGIDVRGVHAQHFRDVRDGSLLIADFAKQTLRDDKNPFSCVGFDLFGNQRHCRTQCSLLLNVQLFRSRSKRKCGLWLALMLRRKINLFTRTALFKALAEPEGIEARQGKTSPEK